MRKKSFIKRLSAFVGAILMAGSLVSGAVAVEPESDASIFNVVIHDKDGEPIPSAFVHLYSHDEEEIVYSGQTDDQGELAFTYAPAEYGAIAGGATHSYFDYLIYVQKTGYSPAPYSLTKIVGRGATNETAYAIIMQEDSSYVIPRNYQTRSINAEGTNTPFSVTKEKSSKMMSSRATTEPTVGYCQHDIPLGHFHANANSTVQVIFKANDKIKVESGFSVDGIFSIASGVTRGFSSTTTFPEFSPASAKKQALATVGRFERYYTTDSFSGKVYWYHELDSIIGGMKILSTTNCSSCDESWASVDGDPDRLEIPVLNGGEYSLEEQMETNLEVSFGIDLKNEGFKGKVGVIRKRGNSTEVVYTPDAGYDLMLYSDDMNWKEPHVTSRAAS